MSKRNNSTPPAEEVFRPYLVSWTGVWVGALTALAVLVVVGLIGAAVGAHHSGPSSRVLSRREVGILALAFSVGGAFFSFVAGGWVAARVAGTSRAETAMLHGAIAWLVAIPVLVVLIALGGGGVLGPWYGGLGGTPAWVQVPDPAKGVTADDPRAAEIVQEKEDAARATRNAALGAMTALILGLAGSALGGWLGSGEPMSYRRLVALRGPNAQATSPIQV